MADGDERRRGILASRLGPFRHPAYAIYWTSGVVSNLGTWLQAVAGSIFIYQLTGSTLAVGVFNFAGFIPILLFSVWGGQLSDRFDRRWVVVLSHIASGLIAAVLAVLAIVGAAGAVHVVVVVFLLNVLWALGKPSLVSLIPNIVPQEDLQDAVGLNALQFIAGQIIGPLIAALVMATSGAGLAFTINAISYLGPLVAMAYLFRRGLGGPEAARKRRSDGAGISAASFLRANVWVPALLVGVTATAAGMEIQRTLAPGLVREVLHLPESTAGIIVAAQSVGSALSLFMFMSLRRRGWARRAASGGFVLQGVGIVVTAVAPNLAVAALGVGVIGFGFSLCFPVLTAVLQDGLPDEVRGRVMAFHQMAHLGNRPFTALFVGAIAAALGIQAGMLASLILVPVGLLALRAAWARLPAVEAGTPTGS